MNRVIQDLADRLQHTKDLPPILDDIRDRYPNVHTRRNVLYRMREHLIQQGQRHDDYEAAIKDYDQKLMETISGSSDDLKRILTLREFYRCDLKRQLMVQKKIQVDPHTDVCDPRDRDFYVNLRILPPWVDELCLSRDDVRACHEKTGSTLMKKSCNVLRVENVAAIIRKCRAILMDEGSSPELLALALGTCTGRRLVEIFETGSFRDHVLEKYKATFSGQAKDGLRSIVSVRQDKSREYTIPLLASCGVIQKALHRLRTKLPNRRRLTQAVKQHIHPEMTFHDLRRLYALVSYEVFKPHRFSLSGWVAHVLGHTGIFISAYYTCLQVSGFGNLKRSWVQEDETLSNEYTKKNQGRVDHLQHPR